MSINKLNFLEKNAGDTLAASEWNQTVGKIDELVEASNNGGNEGVVSIIDDTVSDPSAGVNIATGITNVGTVKVIELTKKKKGVNTTLVSLNNINIEPRESVDDTKGGNISFKPGDDIEFCSHHRLSNKQDEVSIKVIDGDDNPVKLQLNVADMVLTTKDKSAYYYTISEIASEGFGPGISYDVNKKYSESEILTLFSNAEGITNLVNSNGEGGVTITFSSHLYNVSKKNDKSLNITVNNNSNTRGYLKVRALAIDLRCEEHGGIALQPKGEDGQGHQNKIKFEHGGGDGLEFATFNAEKTSIFTDEYRFNEDGVIKLAHRTKIASDKADLNDPTTTYKYRKANDDFYDEFYGADPTYTWRELIEYISYVESLSRRFGIDLSDYYFVGVSPWNYKMTPTEFNTLKALNQNLANVPIYTVNYLDGDLFKAGGIVRHTDLMENALFNYDEEDYSQSLSPTDLNTTLTGKSDMAIFALHIDNNDVWICQKRTIDPKFVVNGQSVKLNDIITLVNYFKTGAGNSQGPWANS